jgi:alpha-ketoglutaric semialdehyde dehydrogenase
MSSINPVLLLPNALKARGAAIAPDFVAALTQGAGQFCTNPGLILASTVPSWTRSWRPPPKSSPRPRPARC